MFFLGGSAVTLQPTDEIKKRLQQHLDKHNLPPDLFDELVDQAIVVNYQAGTSVFLQGSSAEMLLLLVKGIAKVYCPVEGERILARLAGPGDILGQVNFLNGNGHRQLFEVHAATKCEVAVVGRESALRVLQKLDKTDLLRLLDAFNIIWSENLFWFVTLLGVSFRERLEIVLTDLINRFGVKEKRGMLIVPELSQLDLAEMIGSSRPMISRLVKDMTESGELIRHDKQHIISDGVEWLRKNALQGIFETNRNGNGNGRPASAPVMRRNNGAATPNAA
jgi:CRP/FNR family cyclic AMP-dependent transcriptional regulator